MNRIVFVSLILTVILLGCNTSEKLWYFGKGSITETGLSYDPVIKPDDVLGVYVIGVDKELSKPYNLDVQGSNGIGGGYIQGVPSPPGYYVNAEGLIDFPLLGLLKVSDLKREAAANLLSEKLRPYLGACTVIVRILNYKVSVLGEVRNPGTFTIPNEKVSIIEAIGIAGDLLITAERSSVLVIREENGKRSEYYLDLTNKNIFNSPAFYLHQNDIVYVRPNRAKRSGSIVNTGNASLIISSLTVMLSAIIIFLR